MTLSAFAQMRALAEGLDRIDVEVYRAAGRDPLEPIFGGGPADAPVAVMGRDPGRHEVVHGMPFIGAGGQKVREALYEVVHGAPMPGFDASVQIGERLFWANTVPYKPVGNKAWSAKVRRAFRPLIADLLVHTWRGQDVLALGREAVYWFASTRDERAAVDAFWARSDRYEGSIQLPVTALDGTERVLRVHPVPHPSPLNATWAPKVPALLRARFRALGFGG